MAADRLALLRSALRAGESAASIARRLGVSTSSLSRHRTHDTDEAPSSSSTLTPVVVDGSDPDSELARVRREYILALGAAKKAESVDLTLKALRLGVELVRLQDEREDRLATRRLQVVIDLRLAAGYLEIRRAVALALRDFPEARAALAAVLSPQGGEA